MSDATQRPSARTSQRRGRSSTPAADRDLPLERIIQIAEFRAALRTFLRQSETVSKKWGLTPQRYLLLLAIKGAPDGSQRVSFTELARRLKLSRNTVTEICTRAEEAGLLVREPSEEDARVVYVRLTKEGNRRLCGAVAETDADRASFARAFDRVSESFSVTTRQRRRR
jgi:DNA-binding MarR family transcriptional regulator